MKPLCECGFCDVVCAKSHDQEHCAHCGKKITSSSRQTKPDRRSVATLQMVSRRKEGLSDTKSRFSFSPQPPIRENSYINLSTVHL